MPTSIKLKINGSVHSVDADSGTPLLTVLREQLDLTGSKYGCGEGMCGACTVLVDGAARRSCVTPIGTLNGKEITTIEGLEKQGQLHPVQQAFLEMGAFQCAYCTSGMIMSCVSLLQTNPAPNREQIVQSLQGNICRCCTHPRIIEAVQIASKKMQEHAR